MISLQVEHKSVDEVKAGDNVYCPDEWFIYQQL
jgi:hypothetical protein